MPPPPTSSAESAPIATTETAAESLQPLRRQAAPLLPTGQPLPSPAAPSASFDAKQFTIDKTLERRLRSGLPITLELFDGTLSVATCVVHYDLWDEVFDTPAKSRMRTTQQAVGSCMNTVPRSTIKAVER